MTTRNKVNIVLTAMLPAIHEFWQIWKGDYREVNWWLALDYPYSIQWYFKDVGEKACLLIMAILVFRFSRMNESFRLAAGSVLFLQIVDFIMFFVNFNRFNYLAVYLPATPIILLISFFHKEFFLWTRRMNSKRKRILVSLRRKFKTNHIKKDILKYEKIA